MEKDLGPVFFGIKIEELLSKPEKVIPERWIGNGYIRVVKGRHGHYGHYLKGKLLYQVVLALKVEIERPPLGNAALATISSTVVLSKPFFANSSIAAETIFSLVFPPGDLVATARTSDYPVILTIYV